MKEIKMGSTYSYSTIVTEEQLAVNVGSGDLKVFSTPMMLALMENCSCKCLKEFLDDDETSVGIYAELNHTSATPVSMQVTAVSTITAVNGKEIEFNIIVNDEVCEIGNCKHKRFIVKKDKFQDKTDKKLK